MSRLGRALPLLLLCVFGCAGASTQHVGYTPADPAAAQPAARRLVVVSPFIDGRPERTYPAQIDSAYLLMVPFLPYVSLDYERLDESRAAELLIRGALPTPEDFFEVQLARAVAADLAASGLFADVRFAPPATDGADAPPPADADLVLGGTIVSTRLTSTATSYLLGMPGVLLWLTGLPNGRNTVVMEIDLALRDREGTVLWHYPLRAEASRIFDLYTSGGHQLSTGAGSLSFPRYGRNAKGIDPDSLWAFHSDALRTGMAAARRSLAEYLASAN